MNLYHLCRQAGIPISEDMPDVDIGGIKTDSRKIEAGDLFLCIRGFHADGHQYIKEAIEKGAAALMVEERLEEALTCGVPCILVNDCRHEAAMLYDAWYNHPSQRLKLVAVTGTNGKTSVSYMLYTIFEAAMHKCGLIGTVQCRSAGRPLEVSGGDPLSNMTTPDPEQLYKMLDTMVKDGVEYVFMEATSHALALNKLDALQFEAAVFTNLTPEHLDLHKNMENYFFTKARLFSMCKAAILNADDPYGRRLCDLVLCPYITCSVRGDGDFFAENICSFGADGSEYFMSSPKTRFTVRTPLPGSFNVMNTLQAAACASYLGVAPFIIKEALAGLSGIPGRMERVKLGKVSDFSVFVDYAHTPDALENLLKTARAIGGEKRRIVLVFGCGGDRDRQKRAQMGRIAANMADVCVVTSDNSRSEDPQAIIEDILSGMGELEVKVILDRAQAIRYAIQNAQSGDMILLAGKGHEQYEINKKGRQFFCEKEIVLEAIDKKD